MVEAFFTPQPMHYKDDAGEWQPLDTALQEYPDGFGAPGIPVRITRDGLVSLTGWSQQTTRIGLYDPATGTFTARMVMLQGVPSGDCIVREGPRFRHEIRLLEDGLRETLTILEPLGIGAANEWIVIETKVDGITFPDGEVGEFGAGGQLFPLPRATDANGEAAPIKRFAKTISKVQYLYTGIPVSWFATAAYPVVIDPDFAGSTADGYVYGDNADYPTARATSVAYNSTAVTVYLGQYLSAGTYKCDRAFLKFDTSSIPDSDIIQRVNLKLTCNSDNSDTDFDVQIIKQDWSAQDPLSDANREAAYDNCLAGTQDDNIWRNTNGIVLNTQYTSGALSTAWVNKTGNTYYSLRSNRDLNATTPTGYEYISWAAAEHATPAYRPVLAVLYGLTFVAFSESPGASSTTCVIPKPTGLQVGDLMIAHVVFGNSGTTAIPENWTLVNEVSNGVKIRSTVARRIATQADVDATDFTFTSSAKASNIGCISTYIGYDPDTPIDASNGQANAASTTITTLGITPSVANCLILWLASVADDEAVSGYAIQFDNPSWTERYDVGTTAGTDTEVAMATGPRPETSATGNGTATLGTAEINAGHLVAIKPAAAGPSGWTKLVYTSEPPTANAWNQLKQDAGTGWKKLWYDSD